MTETISELQAKVIIGGTVTKDQADMLVDAVVRRCKGNGWRAELIRPLICGYDFNKIIKSFPYDGQERKATCPKCGLVTAFTTPVYLVS